VALADLPSREVLLARIAGAFAAPATQFAGLLAALPRNFAYGLKALIEQGGAPGAPVAEAPAAPVEDAPAADEAPADTAPADTAATDTTPLDPADAETPADASTETPADAGTDTPADTSAEPDASAPEGE
jgi:large subunit ribosomal protein L10